MLIIFSLIWSVFAFAGQALSKGEDFKRELSFDSKKNIFVKININL